MVSQYEKIFTEYENDGIIERMFDSEGASPRYVHYFPHHPVIRKDKETTKTRVIFHESSRIEDEPLNNCLESGPNLLLKIFDIILRFRFNKIVVRT